MATAVEDAPAETTAAAAPSTKNARGRAESAARKERSGVLKKEMDKWVDALGGWDAHGIKTDLATMAVYLGSDVDLGYMQASISMLCTQGTMGDPAYAALTLVNDEFKRAGLRKVQPTYVDMLRAAHGHDVLSTGDDWPFVVQLVSINKLFADETYQRPLHDAFIRELLIKFDERLVGTIDVSQRAGGKSAILDGRQRVETMKKLGKSACWCSIYTGMTVPQEAAFFYHKNRDRKQMAYWYAFRARLLSGDPTAGLISEIVTADGFSMGVVTDHKTVIGAVRAVEDVYGLVTDLWPNTLTPTLQMVKSVFNGRTNSLDGSLLRGLGRFFQLYGKREIQWRHFEDSLRALGPQLVLGRARDREDNTNTGGKIGMAVASTLVEIHNTGLARGERLDTERLPKPVVRRSPRQSRSSR